MSHLRLASSVKGINLLKLCGSTQVCLNPLNRMMSGLPPLKKEQINASLQLKTIQSPSDNGPRPLVLLFGWMLAKQRHLDKYANLYHSKGFDVLSLKMKPNQVLMPKRAQKTIAGLLDVLEDPSMAQRPLLHHGFSVGGYVYGEFLVKMGEQQERYADIRNRMVGQIFDSPVDYQGVPSGFATILAKNPLLRSFIQGSLEVYLKTMTGPVTSHYHRASETFLRNDLCLPTLLLYSKSDPIGDANHIEEVMAKWKSEGVDVYGRCWESSPHVSHFHRHPDEYVEAVLEFLKTIRLPHDQKESIKCQEAQAQ